MEDERLLAALKVLRSKGYKEFELRWKEDKWDLTAWHLDGPVAKLLSVGQIPAVV
jgi:hypothetical protein